MISTFGISSSILFVVSRVLGTVKEAPRDLLNFLLNLGKKSLVALGRDLEFLVCDKVDADLHEGYVFLVLFEEINLSYTSFLC